MTSSEELSQDEGYNSGTGTRFYYNNQYRDSNLNKGYLVGSAAGRDARVFQFQSKYWWSARTTFEAGYRQNKGGNFLPGEATISDGFLRAAWAVRPEWTLEVFSQYERFLVPSYLAGTQHNTSGWFEITWNPKKNLLLKSGK